MASPDWLHWVSLGSGLPIDGVFDLFSDPYGAWDKFKNGNTNSTNKEVADENLAYQRERAKIEDERYEEETAYNRVFAEDERDYNRAFAEDERDYNRAFAEDERAYQREWAADEREYNRALQQQLFEREDTAISRQANELSRLGINPLSQNLNGLGSGSVVSSSPAGSSAYSGLSAPSGVAPTSSGRGGQALHNDFQMQDEGMLSILSTVGSLISGLNGVATQGIQRDSLQLQNDRQYLENLILAHEHGIDYINTGRYKNRNLRTGIEGTWENEVFEHSKGIKNYENYNKIREYENSWNRGYYDSDSPQLRVFKELTTENYPKMIERIATNLSKSFDSLADMKNGNTFDFFKKFMSLF